MSQAQNPTLRNVINSLYRATARVGSGSTADAIRCERATGKLLSPAGHSIKEARVDPGFGKSHKKRKAKSCGDEYCKVPRK